MSRNDRIRLDLAVLSDDELAAYTAARTSGVTHEAALSRLAHPSAAVAS